MKKYFVLFSMLLMVVAPLMAQTASEKSINIIASSLRPVQTDALTGVNIDPIQTDMSNRPCARIKMRVNRMTKAEIGQLEIKIIGGNAQVVRRMVADDGNGLIFEVTARENLRFYIQHPEFGESNDVQLAVGGNKEYYLEAELNQLFTIVVASNTADAEIYIDDKFVGSTKKSGADYLCTIKDVLPGEHKLYLKYGLVETSIQRISVNSESSLFFRQNVNIAATRPQYVVFEVEPKNAIVNIEGKLYPANNGSVMTVLENGVYNYTVTAQGYYAQEGSFTVTTDKVVQGVVLQADAVSVTLTADEGADIYINGTKVGTSTCVNMLASGAYIFEARREGYRPQIMSQTISGTPAEQSYEFKPLEPVYGTLNIVSTPLMASVIIDGKQVGETPLTVDNVLTGSHSVTFVKPGYDDHTVTVAIEEGKSESIEVTLSKSIKYKIGDIYRAKGKEGVVFEVDASGKSGKIVSLAQSDEKLQWCTEEEYERIKSIPNNTTSERDGKYNMEQIQQVYGWREKYPAFAWCDSLGEGWYLPATDELKKLMGIKTVYNELSKALRSSGKTMSDSFLWSSTEDSNASSGCSWFYINEGNMNIAKKYFKFYIRAVSTFGNVRRESEVKLEETMQNTSGEETQSTSYGAQTSAPYKVGDYYNENGREGVVFEVDELGRHGKIVSMTEPMHNLRWCTKDVYYDIKDIGSNTTSDLDGEYNLRQIQKISGWRDKYPAFAWCAILDDGWYLPAKDELLKLMTNKEALDAVNKMLQSKGATKLSKKGMYWSSTQDADNPPYAWYYDGYGSMTSYHKRIELLVRAIFVF